MDKKDARYRYPWRNGNHFELLVDGAQYFPAMLEAIGNARHYVLLEIYLFESGRVAQRFIKTLNLAARRGVRVCLLLDDFGARRLQQRDRHALLQAGVELQFYNPIRYGVLRRNLFRDHRKLLVVDGRYAFTGGSGITDEFEDDGDIRGWHEVMLRIQGPVVADWQALFEQSWARQHNTQPLPLQNNIEALPEHTQTGRLTVNAPSRMEIKRSLLVQLNQAERRIWITTAYFIPSWKIRRRLRKAARQGVDVRLLLPGKHTDHPAIRHAGRRYYTQLLRNGVRIFEYQPRFVHAKILLCDDWVSIGSSNIDRWNLRWNLEANQEVRDPLLATQVQDLFERDFSDSNEMHYRNWRKRPWYRRWQENFWSLIARWLERFSQR